MDIILRWSRDFPGIFINYTLNTTAMSKLDEIEMARQQAGGIVQQFICRSPKNDHEGMVYLAIIYIKKEVKYAGNIKPLKVYLSS